MSDLKEHLITTERDCKALDARKKKVSQLLFNSRTAIAGAIIGLLLVFYNSKNLNCIGALSFF